MQKFEYIIIGSGQGGTPLARALAQAGKETALVESTHINGTCINEGCAPTKTLVASARAAYLARRGGDYGINTGNVTVDLKKVRQRKRAIVDSFRDGSEGRLRQLENLELIMGTARFSGPKTLKVTRTDSSTVEIQAQTIVIDTGTRPAVPRLEGVEQVPYLDSTSIMELEEVPEHLLVIGGGYIGLEFGQMFRRFGSKVTIVHRGDQLLRREDEDISAEVLKILQEDGIEVHLQGKTIRVEPAHGKRDGRISLYFEKEGQICEVTGSHLLLAAGRKPNNAALNLVAAGVETDSRGFIRVNNRLEASAPGIYAIGDINGGPAFTHISYDDFRVLKTNLLDGGGATTENRQVPYTVFIDPQLGRVGLSEKEAKKAGVEYWVATMPMSWIARALEVDESRGMMKVLVDPDSKRILGCAVLGIEGGEIMAMIQIAMMAGLPYTALRDGIFAHPTLAESLNTLFGQLG
ncbi:MAG: mercuric reductase [Spirochaetaceae bacterium]|nr:MAG: mercuric reductase [Spirochaetaceae bacterium]